MPLHFGHKHFTKPDGTSDNGWYAYSCAYCGAEVAGAVIALVGDGSGRQMRFVQCPKCHEGSVATGREGTYPGIAFGPNLKGLPNDVEAAYEEGRRCLSVNAHTATEAMCRKLLMHVAVDKGAAEGQTFASYLDYLEGQGYITPPMRGWVKLIKDHGNESQHKLLSPDRKRAEGTITFTAQLLRIVYEMDHLAKHFIAPGSSP